MGEYTSIDVQSGLPIISYYDRTNTALKVADCRDFVCGDADIRTLRGAAGIFSESVGRHTSITIGEDDLPIISYYNAGPDSVDVIHCEDTGCTEFIDESPWVTLDRHTVGIISPLSRRGRGPTYLYSDRTRRLAGDKLLRRQRRRPQGGLVLRYRMQQGHHQRGPVFLHRHRGRMDGRSSPTTRRAPAT